MVVFLIGYFALQDRFFDETIGGKPVKVYYKRLGVQKNATEEEIKKAYRKLALQLHPDRNPGCEDCGKRFAAISEAYKYLLEVRGTEPKSIPTILDDEFDWLAKQAK